MDTVAREASASGWAHAPLPALRLTRTGELAITMPTGTVTPVTRPRCCTSAQAATASRSTAATS